MIKSMSAKFYQLPLPAIKPYIYSHGFQPKLFHNMTRTNWKSSWTIAALCLQVGGVAVAYAAGETFGHPWSLDILIYAVPAYALFSLIGAATAGIALLRHEAWTRVSWLALAANAIPFLAMLQLILGATHRG
jgi:hypothetical protein